ncbi:MAG: hypothetical protein KGO02_20330 [Alphaproteobacteria bacterium]|nr:hypothetical protein [Alphaproteobacteria bacterium]
MTKQSLLKTIKRWKRYQDRGDWSSIPVHTRGFYVLYRKGRGKRYEVVYIGVAGLGAKLKGGITSRLRRHNKRIKDWSHYSFFEVHDNVTREDIRELECLLLSIFRHDPRIKLENIQKGSRVLYELRQPKTWKQ